MPTLLSFLGPEHSWATQTSAGDFMKAIITVSANASQNEQACIGPNELTRQLVSKPCVERLIGYMLGGGNPLTVGVGIVIEVIRKNNSDYDPDVGPDNNAAPSSRDPIYLGTLLRRFADHVPDFMNLIMNTNAQKQRIDSTFDDKIEPLGFDRFKTCELMAELLHCSNMALLNEVGSEQAIALRDQERQKLRAEGKLIPARNEEGQSSAEDLTMRGRRSSPDDGRRLEVTNASDDDGFEEVTPSGEMTEDTSHEFVKAEDEIPTGQASSFIDRDDDDDFVDEPLSSPRLNVQEVKVNDLPEFENPELMVAPLATKGAAHGTAATDEESKPEGDAASGDAPVSSQDAALPESVADDVSTDKSASAEESRVGDDTPETLTSQSNSTDDSTSEPTAESSDPQPTSGGKTEASSTPSESSPSSEPGQQAAEAPGQGTATPGEASIVVAHMAKPAAPATHEQVEPVVGDYLKIQFVKNQVVPTILVSLCKTPPTRPV
jgi:SIT4-associating protein SAP185/190